MIHQTTRWPEVTSLVSISAESCVHAVLSTCVSRFGVPAVLTSDRGAQFTSSFRIGVCSFLGISASTTASFHLQRNRIIKPFYCFLKTALHSQLAGSDWILHRFLVLFDLRSVPEDDTGLSISEAVYGAPFAIPGEFLGSPELPPSSYLHKIECAVAGFAVPPPHHVRLSLPLQFPSALMSTKYVFVHEDASVPSLAPLYQGPYLVLQRRAKFFRLQLGS